MGGESEKPWPITRDQFEYLLIARYDDGVHMDFPTGWALAKAVPEHDPRCSTIQTNGALLCDCHAIYYLAEQLLGDDLILCQGEAAQKYRESWGPS